VDEKSERANIHYLTVPFQ